MKQLLKHKWIFAGILAGAVGGYLYFYFVGCSSGNCIITSNPLNSSAYGALMGGLLVSSFKKGNSKTA